MRRDLVGGAKVESVRRKPPVSVEPSTALGARDSVLRAFDVPADDHADAYRITRNGTLLVRTPVGVVTVT